MNWKMLLLAAVLGAAACGPDTTEPSAPKVSLAVNGGADQFGTTSGTLADPLQVVVTNPATKKPLANIRVDWKVTAGAGATVSPASSVTGTDGIASTTARLGSATGAYSFEATAENLVGVPARFDARAVLPPVLNAIAPRAANTGDTVTISGHNFSPNPDENIVLFGGLRGKVTAATATQLRAVVPACLPTRTVPVQAMLGAVGSNTDSLAVRGTAGTALQLSRGDAVVFADARDLQCQRVSPQFGSQFLIVPQNYSEVVGSVTPFDLIGVASSTITVAQQLASGSTHLDFGSNWELHLRTLERRLGGGTSEPELPTQYRIQPEIGEKRSFKVFDKNDKFASVTAEVKHISQRAIIYQDVNAPANGFSVAEFQAIAASFDAPTYSTSVAIFGEPSDIDRNGKVIILLSPVVNELTPKGSGGFVAGFFFGCDLQTPRECSGSNQSEIFYLFVPDPTAKHGDSRSVTFVLEAVLPVLAHEFQHMINFAARKNLDALWLSEGLAHMAEDAVGDAYAAIGDAGKAALFRRQNYARAALYLRDSTATSLIAEHLPGSLELRGGTWLLVKYLAGHYGGNALLRRMTQSTSSSVQNVTSATGQSWSKLLSDWAIALWADDAPELAGVALRPQVTFTNINLRQALSTSGGYPLRPTVVGFTDFVVRGTLSASSHRHVLLDAGVGAARSVNLALTGQRGGTFAANAQPQVTIFRVR